MKNKIYRVFIDVGAKDPEDAKEEMLEMLLGDIDGFRIQEDPFNDEEEGMILKLARLAITKFSEIGISDKELKNLQKKIERITNR